MNITNENMVTEGWATFYDGPYSRAPLEVHTVPVDDYKPHVMKGSLCWCRPSSDESEPDFYVHNSMDQREEYEEGRRRIS